MRNLYILILHVFLMSFICVCLCAMCRGFGVRGVSSLETSAGLFELPISVSCCCTHIGPVQNGRCKTPLLSLSVLL